MSKPPAPTPRASRRSRLTDAARLLPFVCLTLLILPVLMLPDGAPKATVGRLLWYFGAWAGLILMTLGVAWGVARGARQGGANGR